MNGKFVNFKMFLTVLEPTYIFFQQSRYPLTIIDGETSCGFNSWHSIHPEAVHSEGKMYEIDWLNAEEGILKAEKAPGEFYKKAQAILKPLDCLVYDGVLKVWTYKSDDAERKSF